MKYKILKKYFGYSSFRQGQEAVIDSILSGKDTVAILPTGAGKSICYQIPALLFPGITIVISPLVSLMIDQVHNLNQCGIRAAYFNSTLTLAQYKKAIYLAKHQAYKLIYVAPERLENGLFLDLMDSVEVSMVAIDEAHCISQWGQNFRPSYLAIADFIDRFQKRPRVCAFSATATKKVQTDIFRYLKLKNIRLIKTGYDRPNLYLKKERPKNKLERLLELVHERKDQVGLIYCNTRKEVELVCQSLNQHHLLATRYHGGLSEEERKGNQEAFLFDRVPIMVATNAFGMGIDKANVRFVIHYSLPMSLENYYQEAGRAGRDGEESECILLYDPKDEKTIRFLIEHQEQENPEQIKNDLVRFERMKAYANTSSCLRNFILTYFNQEVQADCQHCSNCHREMDVKENTVEEGWTQLKQLRMGLARRYKIPPYMIFPDRTLRELWRKKPQNKQEMLQVHGVGEMKYKKFGRYFIRFFKEQEFH